MDFNDGNEFNFDLNDGKLKKMTISSTGKDMLIQFLTDDVYTSRGFRAFFHYILIEPNCANWFNMTAQLLKSPDYPTIDCSWVITAPTISSSIFIEFDSFEVKMKLHKYMISKLFQTLID